MKYKWYTLAFIICVILVLPGLLSYNCSWGEAVKDSPAPEFELKDSSGQLWRLSDLKGKVVFINFWSTWCVACKDEITHKEELFEKMKGRPFQMLGILFGDDPDNLSDLLKKRKLLPLH